MYRLVHDGHNAYLVRLAVKPEPFAKQMAAFRAQCRVVEMMHLAGNKPKAQA